MNGLRLPCCFQLRFVSLPALYLTARSFVSPLPGSILLRLPGRWPSIVPPGLTHPVICVRSCKALTGSCTTSLPFAVVSDPAAVCPTVRLRLTHSALASAYIAGHAVLLFRGSFSTAICSLPTLPASITLHGQGSLPAARTCFAGRVRALALPQGRVEWFLSLPSRSIPHSQAYPVAKAVSLLVVFQQILQPH